MIQHQAKESDMTFMNKNAVVNQVKIWVLLQELTENMGLQIIVEV